MSIFWVHLLSLVAFIFFSQVSLPSVVVVVICILDSFQRGWFPFPLYLPVPGLLPPSSRCLTCDLTWTDSLSLSLNVCIAWHISLSFTLHDSGHKFLSCLSLSLISPLQPQTFPLRPHDYDYDTLPNSCLEKTWHDPFPSLPSSKTFPHIGFLVASFQRFVKFTCWRLREHWTVDRRSIVAFALIWWTATSLESYWVGMKKMTNGC